jgi:hypothetical protein
MPRDIRQSERYRRMNLQLRQLYRVSDGVAIREITARQGPVDHRQMRACAIFGFAPDASFHEPYAQHAEVARVDKVD